MNEAEEASPTLSARPNVERMRRYRQRRRRGERSIRVEIGSTEIEILMTRKYLEPTDRENPKAIQDAASMFIADAFFEAGNA